METRGIDKCDIAKAVFKYTYPTLTGKHNKL